MYWQVGLSTFALDWPCLQSTMLPLSFMEGMSQLVSLLLFAVFYYFCECMWLLDVCN